ncbi:MAG TPA: hypothetical protein VGN81_12850 [Pseudonocardiaceae bacterium]|jgi:hypothetical protein
MLGFAFFAPVISFALLVVKLIFVGLNRRLIPHRRSVAWAQAAVAMLCAAATVYSIGVWSGGFFDIASSPCAAKLPANPAYQQSWFPLANACRYLDGTSSRPLVPSYVNPTVFTCLAGAAICVALVAWSASREIRYERASYADE